MNERISKPSVLHISHNYHVVGGSDRYFMELGDLLKAEGHHVIPFCAQSPNNLESPYQSYFPASATTEDLSLVDAARLVYSAKAHRNINRLLDIEHIDLAHLHIYYGKLTSSILGPLRARGIPIVQTLHEYKHLCAVYTCIKNNEICEACAGRYFYRCIAGRCNRGSLVRSMGSAVESYISRWLGSLDKIDHFIGVSQFMTDKMISIGIPTEKISTIHNFIDATRYTPDRGTQSYVLYFGRLEKTKGIFTLIEAMHNLPNIRCLIAGDGSARAELQAEIDKAGTDNVELVGFAIGEKLHDLIRNAVCTVLPSEWYENCPMSVLESLALATPVVGTHIGGIPELIEEGVDGRLVEPFAPDQLAAAISELAEKPELAAQAGSAGRAKVEKYFNAAIHYEQIHNIYNNLLERGSGH
jgi:glycosyltransferase involved in cell wall biosynthesis